MKSALSTRWLEPIQSLYAARQPQLWTWLAALLCAVASAATLAQALPPPAGGPYVLSKQAIAAGGARASGGVYVLTGTVAQAALDPSAATAAGYSLTSGFHFPSQPLADDLFADGFED